MFFHDTWSQSWANVTDGHHGCAVACQGTEEARRGELTDKLVRNRRQLMRNED